MVERFTRGLYMSRRYAKYTKEILEPLVQESLSFRQVMLKLGLKETGGSHANLKARVKQYNISTEHFLGKGHNYGQKARNRKTANEILVINSPDEPKTKVEKLRRALDEVGVSRVCVDCGGGEIWNNKAIVLQVDHINGCTWDNRQENLRYLCPNCHSQTDTFGIWNKQNRIAQG